MEYHEFLVSTTFSAIMEDEPARAMKILDLLFGDNKVNKLTVITGAKNITLQEAIKFLQKYDLSLVKKEGSQ